METPQDKAINHLEGQINSFIEKHRDEKGLSNLSSNLSGEFEEMVKKFGRLKQERLNEHLKDIKDLKN